MHADQLLLAQMKGTRTRALSQGLGVCILHDTHCSGLCLAVCCTVTCDSSLIVYGESLQRIVHDGLEHRMHVFHRVHFDFGRLLIKQSF